MSIQNDNYSGFEQNKTLTLTGGNTTSIISGTSNWPYHTYSPTITSTYIVPTVYVQIRKVTNGWVVHTRDGSENVFSSSKELSKFIEQHLNKAGN